MPHDLVIREGLVVDGLGTTPSVADIAVDGHMITDISIGASPGRKEILARGRVVTPGFIDAHTHLDAQIGWDPLLAPLSGHGVTTAVLGNCGVSFAPVREGDAPFLGALMEGVEEIPAGASVARLGWNWQDYGSYVTALRALRPAINVAGLVGHSTLRRYVMGNRALGHVATDIERSRMAEVVRQSIASGAIGVSMSLYAGHAMPDGRRAPGFHAAKQEYLDIARAVQESGGGMLQFVNNLSGNDPTWNQHVEGQLLCELARFSRVRVLLSAAAGQHPDSGRAINSVLDAWQRDGLDVSIIVLPRITGPLAGMTSSLPWTSGSWRAFAALNPRDRLRVLDESEPWGKLVDDARQTDEVDVADFFWLGEGEHPDYLCRPEASLAAMAERTGEHPALVFLRLSQSSRGAALWMHAKFNRNATAHADLLAGRHVIPGLGDAGAHWREMVDAGWCAHMLAHWVRDTELFSVSEAVRRMTSAPARILGLTDRGRLERGLRADINVIDLEHVAERMPEYSADYSPWRGRLMQRSSGFDATICNGDVVMVHGDATGARSGQFLPRSSSTNASAPPIHGFA